MKSNLLVVAVALSAIQGGQVLAAFGILGVQGGDEVAEPTNLSTVESCRPIVFQEAAGVQLAADLRVDHNGSGVFAVPAISGNTINSGLVPGVVLAGSVVDSYMMHFNPVGTPLLKTYVTAITFASPVIGVQLFSGGLLLKDGPAMYIGTLELGDAIFGPQTYPTAVDRGVEEDAFVLVVAGNTVMLAGSVSGAGIDQVRFLTVGSLNPGGGVVPEPLSLGVWSGIACVAGLRRRR